MKTLILLIVLILIQTAFGQSKFEPKIIEGDLTIYVTEDFFDFPLESYGAYISFPTENTIRIDSLVVCEFQPGSRLIKTERVVSYEAIKNSNSKLLENVNLEFESEIISLFKLHSVFFIRRAIKTFSISDTLARYVNKKGGGKYLKKSKNYNRILDIKFLDKANTKKFRKELLRNKSVVKVEFNAEAIPF